MEVETLLEHHGIKGQRWGIRHDPTTGKTSVDHRVAAQLKRKPLHTLTNKQLKTTNERLNLEQNFNRLNPSTVKRGESHVKAVVATASLVSSIVAISTSPLGKAVAKLIKKNSGRAVKIKQGASFI